MAGGIMGSFIIDTGLICVSFVGRIFDDFLD